MIPVRYLKAATLEGLRESVPRNLDRYRNAESFDELVQDPMLTLPVEIEADSTRLAALDAGISASEREVENCILVYEALKNLTLYDARDERLWVYLCHTLCLPYARARWPIPADDIDAITHIRSHFFAKNDRQIERDNAMSRLWWMAELCERIEGLELPVALQILLHRTDARAQIMERPTMSQNTLVLSGILRALRPHLHSDEGLFKRSVNRAFMQELNTIGGFLLLDVLPAEALDELIAGVAQRTLSSGAS